MSSRERRTNRKEETRKGHATDYENPYNYCAGNPVRLVDPDGRTFTETAEKWATNLEKDANRRLSKTKFGSKMEKELTATIKEIQELRISEQVYDVRTYEKEARSGETDLRGFVSYDQDKDQFVINENTWRDASTEGSDLGSFAHELKHAYQFEMGQLSFITNREGGVTKMPGYFYDFTDEKDVHRRGGIFGANASVDNSVYLNLGKEKKSIVNLLQLQRAIEKKYIKPQIYRYEK